MKNAFFRLAFILMSCSFIHAQQYRVLHNFGGPGDGTYPFTSLVPDHSGNLYGTTSSGGANNAGIAFQLSHNSSGIWKETVLYSFCSLSHCADGAQPFSAPILDADGNIYGTTRLGGSGGQQLCADLPLSGCGVAYELSPPHAPGGAWTESVLYNFCSVIHSSCSDGAQPIGNLVFDSAGNLYGATQAGGNGGGGLGLGQNGMVFELSPGSAGWTETAIYNFCPGQHGDFCPDGSYPAAGVTLDNYGNLYGTTEIGGSSLARGGGAVYKLIPGSAGWTESVLWAFRLPYTGGSEPLAGVTVDPMGNVYSTTSVGGNEFGSVFRIDANGKGTEMLFNGSNGGAPYAGIVLDFQRHMIYGTTVAGGDFSAGVVYGISPQGNGTVLYSFCTQTGCPDGESPYAGLLEDAAGTLFGTTAYGGSNGRGVVFMLKQ